MKKLLPFYPLLVPPLWTLLAVASFFHSGDEHGCFACGAAAGTWMLIYLPHQLSTETTMLYATLTTGVIVVGLAGALMDLLRVRKWLWFTLFAVCAAGVFAISASQFESFEAMANKHRTVWAVVFCTTNVGLYLAIVLSVVVTALVRLWQLIDRHSRQRAGAVEDEQTAQ